MGLMPGWQCDAGDSEAMRRSGAIYPPATMQSEAMRRSGAI
jgi:hypothetical protein